MQRREAFLSPIFNIRPELAQGIDQLSDRSPAHALRAVKREFDAGPLCEIGGEETHGRAAVGAMDDGRKGAG